MIMSKDIIKIVLYILLIVGSSSLLTSCGDDITGTPDTDEPEYMGYDLVIPSTSDSETLILNGYEAPLNVTVADTSWLSYDIGTSADGITEVRLYVNTVTRNQPRRQIVTIADANGRRGIINVTLAVDAENDLNGDDMMFVSDWENQESVEIYYNRGFSPVKTPWSKDASITNIPESIRDDVKKADGWEMAFSKLGVAELEGANYFGLYNKYTGILRIFYYVSDVWNSGSEYCLEVDMGNKNANVKFPFYNSLNYAIPTSLTAPDVSSDLLGLGSVHTTFKTFITPYNATSSTALSLGWTAFDLDASGFCPTSTPWKNSNESISLHIKSTQTSLVSLCGELTADINGNFSHIEGSTASTSSGVGKVFSQIGSYATAGSGVVGAITKAIWGKDISGTIKGIGSACNIVGSISDYILANPYEEKAAVDSMAGKVELAMTGNISLSGKISSDASNSCPPITIRALSFLPSHFGEGVWSLKKSPVVYLVGDRLIGDVNRFSLQCYGNGKYGIGQGLAEKYNLRMVTFLDPESIELNINESVFPDITEVEVLAANFGVYPREEKGHISKYRSLLGIRQPTLKISDASTGVWRSYSENNDLKYHMIPVSSLLSPEMYETESNCSFYAQTGGNYKYYGCLLEEYGKPYIQNPQILLPSTASETEALLYDGEIPDLIVTVVIRFKSNGRTFMFSQRYIPEVKVITGSGVQDCYNALKRYKTKCVNGTAINTVNGKPVKHTTGNATVERILKIFDTILK